MGNFTETIQQLWTKAQSSPARVSFSAEIPGNHVKPAISDEEIKSDEHYFIIRINEMYLAKSRNWFNSIDPMVFFISQFNYDGKSIAIPYVIGPGLIEKFGKEIPEGMVFLNTPVAGFHPYKGGGLTLSVILYENTRKNYAKELLRVVENVSNAAGFSNLISQYIKVGDAILDGVASLVGLGDTNPLVGFQKNYNPKAGDVFASRYFVLINVNEDKIESDKLRVINNQLYLVEYDDDPKPKPYRGADYVLYSIMGVPERDDLNTISFYPQYESMIMSSIDSATDLKWQATKAEMMNLAKNMRFNPDLTRSQYLKLRAEYETEMVNNHKEAISSSTLAAGGKEKDPEGKSIMEILRK